MQADLKRIITLIFLLRIIFPAFSSVPDCEVLRNVSYRVVTPGKLIQTDTVVLQINDRFGENYSTISLPFSELITISRVKAWIEDLSGKVVRTLKNSEFSTTSNDEVATLYSDIYVKTFSLKHNIYPYKICYTYQLTQTQFTTIADWSPVYNEKIPTREGRLVVTFPRNYPVHKFLRKAACYYSDSTGNEVTCKFSSSYDVIRQDEIFAEPVENVVPLVLIAPYRFFYGVEGSTESWKTYGNWCFRLNSGLLDLPESESKTVLSLVSGINDKKEIIRILYYYLQDHTRYINVRIGTGGMKSFPASYVAKNKYGDCKALTTYMKALLKIRGIESFYTLVYASETPVHLIEEMPVSQFNHVILCVPLGKDTLWIDNTAKGFPLGYVNSFVQNRRALLVDKDNSRLVRIFGLTRREVLKTKTLTLWKNENRIQADAAFSFGGHDFEWFTSLRLYADQNKQDKKIREFLSFSNFEAEQWRLKTSPRDSARIDLASTLNTSSFFKSVESDVCFTAVPSDIGSFIQPSERKMAIQLSYPVYSIDTLRVQIPSGLELKYLPETASLDSPYGNYKIEFLHHDNTVSVIKRYELFPGWYPSSEYSAFYAFIKSFRAAENKSIVLQKKVN
jgi:hypothetical protein